MPFSLYIHIPFCLRRCHYCDFNTYTGKDRYIAPYVDALINELRIAGDQKGCLSVHSIYFGGGTPSLIHISDYKKIFKAINHQFTMESDCEISLEANPGTLSLDYLLGLVKLGFNRISLGVQSTNMFDLTRLDRVHDVSDILTSVKFAKKAGFKNISFDLLFDLPWQDVSDWENNLTRALMLEPAHLSVYALIIEPGTPFYDWHQKGLITPQDQDLSADLYEVTMAVLEKNGFEHYEISNWAKREDHVSFRCRHNLQYWLNKPYLGFGAGAHGYAEGIRTENTSSIEDYIKRMKGLYQMPITFPLTPAALTFTKVDITTQMKDFMLFGLRLVKDGVSCEEFEMRYGLTMKSVFNEEINLLTELNLVEWSNAEHRNLRLTNMGVMLANQVFMAFI